MELTESIKSINAQLIDLFGIDTISGLPIWRVVYSEDQLEKRLGTFDDISPNGIFIRTVTEVREVPKYRQWIQNKYVLERLTVVPIINSEELPDIKISYEPLWIFEDGNGNYLPPKLEAAKFIINTVYAVQYGNHDLARYKDPESSQEETLELKRQRVDNIVEELYGDESNLLGQTLSRNQGGGEAIVVPSNYKKEN